MEFEERYFREELDYLRQLSKLLATEKPHLARFLAEKDADPDIERLLEGVAFLTGNLRQKIEDEFPELTHGLIKMLWPNYLRPVPAMTLIEYTPDMDKSSVPVLIPRNEQFTTNAGEIRVDEVLPSDAKKEEPPPCTFTLCRDIWLLPVRLEQIENRSTTRNGVINITFSVAPGTDFRTLDLNKLRFWLGNDDNYTRDQLYLWFCEYLQGADLTVGEQHLRLPEFMLKAVGFEPQDAMLPWPKNVHSGYPGMTHRHQLADTVVNGFSADPLQALQSESLITTGDPLSGIAAVRPSAPLSDPASNGGINTPFMDLPPIYASPGDRNDDVSAAEMAQRHLAVTPLLRGLGGSLTMSNSDDADDFLEEAGRTLQAAIKGLLDLQQQRNSLSDKHLRPLEDNPLRLNMDYATALDVMFAEGKSPVHLAAPAAVSESLRNVRHHEEANRAAIVESLRVLLDAFSPQNLLRRFVQYRRSHELRQPLDDAGAWQMYSHYYEELASDRQQGFEMLFNEVYAQVYDRVLREKQREPEA